MAENGHWEEVNWYPPEGTFPPDVKVPPVHFAAASPTESANQQWEVTCFMRSVDVQTATGHQIISQVYTIHKGQTVNIPEIEIQNSGIPVGYHPRLSPLEAQYDKVIEHDGHYYLTGAPLTYNEDGIVYHGANLTAAPGTINFNKTVILSAPINLVYQDLSGSTYTVNGNAAVYRKVAQVDYGQSLYPNQIYFDALNYLNQYVSQTVGTSNSNYQLYGYFDSDGKLHPIQSPADYPRFTDAKFGSDGLTYRLAIINRHYGKVGDPVTKKRTIIVTKPDGKQEQTIQEVTLAQFADYDGITGDQLCTPVWKVLTGDQPDSDDDWAALTADNHDWQAFTTPSIAGYTPSLTGVASQTVTSTTKDQIIKINYQANQQRVRVIYKDSGKVVKTTELTGKTGQTVKVDLDLPAHYFLLNQPASTYTFQASGNQDIIVELGHQTQATSREKSVTRQIIITDPTGHTKITTQKATLNQTGMLDLVTQQTNWGDWTTGHWDSFSVPQFAGYTPSQDQVLAQVVTSASQDQTTKISYQADPQSVRVIYKDGNRIVKTEKLAGKTGQTVNVVISAPDHYQIINHPATTYTFRASGNQDIIVELGHQTQTTSREKSVTRQIIITDPAGKSTTTTQTATLTQSGVLDLVTNQTSWGDWTTGHWDSFSVPQLAGYTPSQGQIAAQTVTSTTENQIIKINYQANLQRVRVIYKDGDRIVKTEKLAGKTGQTVDVVIAAPDHYQIINHPATTYTFRASGNQDIIVELGHRVQATHREKTVTRRIVVTDPAGHSSTTTQKATLTQAGVLDLVTNQTSWGDWTTDHWDSFSVPQLAGYTPSQDQLPAQVVTDASQDQVVEIGYQADPQSVRVIYKDDGKVVKTAELNGKTGQTVKLDLAVPAHYSLLNQPDSTYTFRASGNQDVIVELGHQTKAISHSKTVTRRIVVTDPAGRSTTTTQKATLYRTGVLDLVTQQTNWGGWTTDHWASFVVPQLAGYTPNQARVASHTVTDQDQDVTVEIHYQADDQNVKIVYVTPDGQVIRTVSLHGQTDTLQALPLDVPAGYQLVAGQQIPQTVVMKSQMANIMIVVTKVVPREEQAGANKVLPGKNLTGGSQQLGISGQSSTSSPQNQEHKQLPQTGNKDAGVTGLVLLATLSMLGFGYRKRNSLKK